MDGFGGRVGGKKGPMASVLGALVNANPRNAPKTRTQWIIHHLISISLGSLVPSVLTIEMY